MVAGVLENGNEDFHSCEDVYEAVGPILESSCSSETMHDDIMEVCQSIYNVLSQ